MPVHAGTSPSRFLHALSAASFSRPRALALPSVATADLIVRADAETTLEDALSTCDSSCLDDAVQPDLLRLEGTGAPDDEPSAALLDPLPSRVIRSTGAIEADVNLFRALLGNPNNNAIPGQQAQGRREINWDAVPAGLTNVPHFPNNFFNANSPRGLVYGPTSRGLQVSDQSFVDINPDYADEFHPFSGHKVFSPIGKNESDIRFFVAGSGTTAAVRGFGVVFVDVDKGGLTSFQLFGEDDVDLGTFFAPVRVDRRGASFIGVVFRNPVIRRVHIVAGNAPLSADEIDVSHGGLHDLVVMDDFLYGEPTATGQ